MTRLGRVIIALPLCLSASTRGGADALVEYRPGETRFHVVWDAFYQGDHEPDLDDPLIAAGRSMRKAICDAVSHKDMKFRRYAIGALGYIGDQQAIRCLLAILKDKKEEFYFREDALQAIYCLNKNVGVQYAKKYESDASLNVTVGAILRGAPWPCESTAEAEEE